MINNYKVIEINNVDVDKRLLEPLFKKYPTNDLYFELSDNTLTTYLNKLNLKTFSQDINTLIKTHQNEETNLEFVLTTLVKKIEDIKSYGLNGNKRVYVDYNKERKVQNRTEKEAKRVIHYYANDNKFAKQNNVLSEEQVNNIITGDSEEVLKKYPDNCIDVIFTSPPYNFGLEYSDSPDDHFWDNYFDKLFKIFEQCIRVLKYGGRLIVNIQPLFSDYIPSHHIISNYLIQKKMIWKGEILWEKNNYNCKYTAWGSWKSPSSPYLKYTWEFLEIFCKGTLLKSGKNENADISADDFKKWVVAKWSIAPERKMKEYGHPAMFPEELVKRSLQLFSFKNDIVLDPFNGAGTTTYIAKILNRKFIGIDISDEYSKIAIKRLYDLGY